MPVRAIRSLKRIFQVQTSHVEDNPHAGISYGRSPRLSAPWALRPARIPAQARSACCTATVVAGPSTRPVSAAGAAILPDGRLMRLAHPPCASGRPGGAALAQAAVARARPARRCRGGACAASAAASVPGGRNPAACPTEPWLPTLHVGTARTHRVPSSPQLRILLLALAREHLLGFQITLDVLASRQTAPAPGLFSAVPTPPSKASPAPLRTTVWQRPCARQS